MNWGDYFTYDPLSGSLSRIRRASIPTGCVCSTSGYMRTRCGGRKHLVHRIVYEMHFGQIPDGMQIDHIDGDKLNNRIENLRLATHSQNQHNRGAYSSNTSGMKGVYWHKSHEKWSSAIRIDGALKHLGLFDTKELAHIAYCEAAKRLHGEFARFK